MSPFGGWYDRYYQDIYAPAIKDAGLSACRADDLYRPSAIVQDIWAYVKQSTVMLADLTGKNPNVLYELGLAHANDKPVVLLAQTMEDVPFDLQALRVIVYEIEAPDWAQDLRSRITAAVKEVLKAPSSAILRPFQKSESDATSQASKSGNGLGELRREINLLRNFVMHPSGSKRTIDPGEAEVMIRSYIRQHMPITLIVDRLEPLGPPESWIRRKYKEMLARMRTTGGASED